MHKFLKNLPNDTDVTQQKFISQLVIQDEMCIYNFDSESEQQSMQCNERIGQNCHFITLRNSSFFHVECKQPTTAKMHKIFIAQKSYCGRHVLSLDAIRSKYYFNFILNRTRSGRELWLPLVLMCLHGSYGQRKSGKMERVGGIVLERVREF